MVNNYTYIIILMKPVYSKLPQDHHFDYAYLMHVLRPYRSPRDKVTQMFNRGEIIRIKKGLYVRAPDFGGHIYTNEIANALYGPSYISLEYVLSLHSLIPERVVEITSVTLKRNKFFQTPVGTFSYRHIRQKAFSVGVHLIENESGRYFIATKGKALCDKVALASNIRTIAELKEYIYDNLRIEPEDFRQLDFNELSSIKDVYGCNRIDLLFRLLSGLNNR